jgi:hypothetical protein
MNLPVPAGAGGFGRFWFFSRVTRDALAIIDYLTPFHHVQDYTQANPNPAKTSFGIPDQEIHNCRVWREDDS